MRFFSILSTNKYQSLIKHGVNLGLNMVHGQPCVKYHVVFCQSMRGTFIFFSCQFIHDLLQLITSTWLRENKSNYLYIINILIGIIIYSLFFMLCCGISHSKTCPQIMLFSSKLPRDRLGIVTT